MRQIKARTMSLPKLKTPKITDQIHKVRWSIAPKCLLYGHQGKQITNICINPQCELPSRLVCSECIQKQHQIHKQCLLAIDEVKCADIKKLRGWPFDQKYKKMYQFVVKHQQYINNLVQDINATFNDMSRKINNQIQKIRQGLLKKIDSFYIKETQKQKFTEKLVVSLQQCFQLKRISETVRRVFCKQIRHQIFIQKMHKILNEQQIIKKRENLLKYFEAQQKGSDMFFDKMLFLKKQAWIVQQINDQKKRLFERPVQFDESDSGMDRIVSQTVTYLSKIIQNESILPLTYDKQQLPDGSLYKGFFYNGEKSIIGMKAFKTGFTYYGEWKNNYREGWGMYENKVKDYKYIGQWKNDRKQGYGREKGSNWIYDGNFSTDKKQGFGIFIQDGIRWEINWRKDKKHGEGRVIDKDGNIRQVYYNNGLESVLKVVKPSPAFDIKELSKRFNSMKASDISLK